MGLGGRHDAVNIVECDVAVITSIDFDHQDYLGDTLEKIAYEKVGIARAFKPVICGDLDPPVSISNYCEEINSPLWLLHRDFTFKKDVNTWEWRGRTLQFTALPYAKLKIENVATALAVIEYLWPNLPKSAIDSGIKTAGFAGRFEKTADGIIFDVAHNPEATQWLAEQLQRDFPNKKITAIFSMLRDKDIAASMVQLKNIIDEWCVIELDCPRAATIAELNTILTSQSVKKWYNFSTANSALQHAKQSHDPKRDVIIVFGSFYTVAAVKGALEWTSS